VEGFWLSNEDKMTNALHGDAPSAWSRKGFSDRKELAAFAFERTRMPMVVTDANEFDHPIVLANKAFLELTGYTAAEVIGRNCRILQGMGTSPIAIASIRSALLEERETTVELLNYRKDGSAFWNRLHISPIHNDDGTLAYFFGSQVDVTEQRRIEALEASEHRLLKEVDHRARNVLAIVESIVRLSNADDPHRYAAAIQQRVEALARVHTLLAESGWNAVSLEEVVRKQVGPFAARRLTIAGPKIMLPAPVVQPLGLVFHELAVNAVRHGSLAARDGRVRIEWTAVPDGDRFALDWIEQGTTNQRFETKNGFGSILIAAMIEKQLRGTLARKWTGNGLELRMAVPIPTGRKLLAPRQ
jgi:PAS domain S-box-containing protein